MLQFYLHVRFLILSSSGLKASATLQVKLALVYFAKFHKHTEAHRSRLHTRIHSMHTHRQTHIHTHTHVQSVYSSMTLAVRVMGVFVLPGDAASTRPHPECTHQTSKSSNNVISVSALTGHLSPHNKFTTLTGEFGAI